MLSKCFGLMYRHLSRFSLANILQIVLRGVKLTIFKCFRDQNRVKVKDLRNERYFDCRKIENVFSYV